MIRERSIRTGVAVAIIIAAILACIAILSSCSSTGRIAGAANVARSSAASSEDRFVLIEERAVEATAAMEVVRDEAKAGAKEQRRIIESSDVISREVAGVQDKPSDLLSMLTWGSIAVVAVAVAVVLWQTGIGSAIRSGLGLIPRPKRTAAKLLDEAMDDASATTLQEAIAAMRASDREFDAAWRRRRTDDGLR